MPDNKPPDTEVEANTAPEKDPRDNIPKHPSDLKGADLERAKIWARQSKDGTITLCKQKGCYHPVAPVLDAAGDTTTESDSNGKKYIVAQCTWDPGHGEQRIYAKTKEDEFDPEKFSD